MNEETKMTKEQKDILKQFIEYQKRLNQYIGSYDESGFGDSGSTWEIVTKKVIAHNINEIDKVIDPEYRRVDRTVIINPDGVDSLEILSSIDITLPFLLDND